MMKCLKYEWYKLLSQKIFSVSLAVCILLSAPLLYYTAEKQAESGANIGVTQAEYDAYLAEIENAAARQGSVSIFQNSEDTFSSRNIIKTADDMAKMSGVIIKSDNSGVQLFFDRGYAEIIVLALSVLSVYIIFFKEKENNLYSLIKTTPNGNRSTYFAKTGVLFGGGFALELIFSALTLLIIPKFGGFGNLGRSVQSVPAFMSCDIKCSVFEMMLLIFALRVIGTFLASLVFSVIALKVKNPVLFIFADLCVTGLSILCTFIPHQSALSFFKYVNLVCIFDPARYISAYKNLDIFGFPVNSALITAAVIFAAILLLTVMGMTTFQKKELVSKKIKFKLPKMRRSGMNSCKSVFIFEMYKAGFTDKAILIFLIFTAILSVKAYTTEFYRGPEDYYYSNYIEILQGELTQEKVDYIENEKQKIKEADEAAQALNKQHNKGEISLEELQNRLKKYEYSENRKSAFARIENRYEYIKENPNAHFVYEAGFEKLFNVGEKNQFFGLANFTAMMLLIVICSSFIVPLEYKSGMARILNCTVKGTKVTKRVKRLSAALYALMFSLISCCGNLFVIYKNYGLNNASSPLCSIQEFSEFQSITILGGLLVKLACICLLGIAAAVFTTVITEKITKKSLQ